MTTQIAEATLDKYLWQGELYNEYTEDFYTICFYGTQWDLVWHVLKTIEITVVSGFSVLVDRVYASIDAYLNAALASIFIVNPNLEDPYCHVYRWNTLLMVELTEIGGVAQLIADYQSLGE